MTPKEFIADSITSSYGMVEMTLADFSDADMLKRPCGSANNAAWQLGHLVAGDAFFAKAIGATGFELPAGWDKKFTKETSKTDDAKAFPAKSEMLGAWKTIRQAAARRVREMSDDDMNQPAPENIRSFCPTNGHVATLFSSHASMHLGQFQVIRRSLGKPVLF